MRRRTAACDACGAPAGTDEVAYDLVLPGGARVALAGELTVGRGRGNTIRLQDPSVSRHHVRVRRMFLEDVGSTHGTVVDGQRVSDAALRDGSRIRLGDSDLLVERRRMSIDAGRTLIVRPGATITVEGLDASSPVSAGAPSGDRRPRLRSGWALKRLDASEGPHRWVLKDLRERAMLQLSETDAEVLGRLDGSLTVHELLDDAERRFGAEGLAQLAELLAELADRGLLAETCAADEAPAESLAARLLRPRRWTWRRAGAFVDAVYVRGGWMLFTRAGWVVGGALALVGLAAFAALLASGAHRPFYVADQLSIGAATFILGRVLVAFVHELAHALTVASFGRTVGGAGVRLVLIFPYLFVDASDAWFEPRRRRLAIAAAGPACDLAAGGACALAAVALHGTGRDIAFQLALGAYLGALFNLNPLLDRDGCRLLADALREPDLRRRARLRVARALAGQRDPEGSRALLAYGGAALAWSLLTALFVVAASQRFRPMLESHVPVAAAWALLAAVYLLLLAPPLALIAPALLTRARGVRDAG